MALQKIELTPALRPHLLPNETVLFVQDAVGLYEGRLKLPNQQNGTAYLTSHRACYVDNEDPRKYSVAVDLKTVDKYDFYAGFLKSSPKITLHLSSESPTRSSLNSDRNSFTPNVTPPRSSTPIPQNQVIQWICPICSYSNIAPSNFSPGAPVPPCLTCGMKPPASTILDAMNAANIMNTGTSSPRASSSLSETINHLELSEPPRSTARPREKPQGFHCPRCTFINHPSLMNCEICGERLLSSDIPIEVLRENENFRSDSPAPAAVSRINPNEVVDSIKLSFRSGGEKVFHEKLKGAMIQRIWLLDQAPTTINNLDSGNFTSTSRTNTTSVYVEEQPQERAVGIRGLERQNRSLRRNNQIVLSGAFEDLDALMSRAQEIIALAQSFASQIPNDPTLANSDTATAINDSLSALSVDSSLSNFSVTKDHISSSSSSSSSSSLYHAELARSVADFLSDDKRAILKREGGAITLVDLWAVYNRARGIELISPSDLEKAAKLFDKLKLPVKLRKFKSGLLVVQEKSRTDETIIRGILLWIRSLSMIEPRRWGCGVSAREAAEKFGWSVGIAREELEMAEDRGSLCREVGVEGVKFWENFMAVPRSG